MEIYMFIVGLSSCVEWIVQLHPGHPLVLEHNSVLQLHLFWGEWIYDNVTLDYILAGKNSK